MDDVQRARSIEMRSNNTSGEKSSLEQISDPENTDPNSRVDNDALIANDKVNEAEYIHGWTLGLVMFALLMSYFLVALDLVCFASAAAHD